MQTIEPKGKCGATSQCKNIYLSIVLIAIGGVWLLHNLDIISTQFFDIFFSWRTLLVAIGGYLLSQGKWVSGIILVVLGVSFILNGLFGDGMPMVRTGIKMPIFKIAMPVALIVIGIVAMVRKKSSDKA